MLIFQNRAGGEYSRPLLLPRRQQATPPPVGRLPRSAGPGQVFGGGGLSGLGPERLGRGSQTGRNEPGVLALSSAHDMSQVVPPEDRQLFLTRICADSLNEVDPAEMPVCVFLPPLL